MLKHTCKKEERSTYRVYFGSTWSWRNFKEERKSPFSIAHMTEWCVVRILGDRGRTGEAWNRYLRVLLWLARRDLFLTWSYMASHAERLPDCRRRRENLQLSTSHVEIRMMLRACSVMCAYIWKLAYVMKDIWLSIMVRNRKLTVN